MEHLSTNQILHIPLDTEDMDWCLISNSSHQPGDTFTCCSGADVYVSIQRPDLLVMARLPYKRHSYLPQRQAALLPCVVRYRVQLELEAIPSETGAHPAATLEEPTPLAEHLFSDGFCETGDDCYNRKHRGASEPAETQTQPWKDIAALLKTIRIHPEAQRVLGNSCIPVVSLKRLNFRSVFLASLQPVVSLVRLPSQTPAALLSDASCLDRPQQNAYSKDEPNVLEIREPRSKPAGASELSQPGLNSWNEPFSPESSSSEEPEQDSGFDCESNPDQPYILFDEWDPDGKTDSETFYLDPDPEQTMVIELDPDTGADPDVCLELEDESKCDADVVQMDDNEDQRPGVCYSVEEADPPLLQQEAGPGTEEMESEDFCAVCLNGGDLLCCDCCPKVYHLACHIPALSSFPLGDWACTLCRTDQDPVETYDCEDTHSCGGVRAPYILSHQDQKRCEKLTLLLYCHALSAPFHEPVSPLARNYYQIIKRPVDLSVVRRKLDKSNTLHYFTAGQFVDDVLLMFRNCATFNYPDSEVAQAGRNLEGFFFSKLQEVFPDQTFPSTSQDSAERARLRWLGRKRKENHRRKRHVFHGKKYYL